MTDRLYYDNAYLREFDARVEELREVNGVLQLRLDRSAFYPTSGGQPYDTGYIGEARVLDVCVDGDHVWHSVDRAVEGEVHCSIDWERRFDHMQQHSGEHMIAGAVYELFGGHTIGLHLGKEISTIDIDLPDGRTRLEDREIREIEILVNRRIQENHPIRCWFPDAGELKRLPLRKPPTVSEHIRIVGIGEFEYVACGGTHPRSTGEIGLVKIVDARPSKGKLRLGFVCGMRAYLDYCRVFEFAHAAAAGLSTGVEGLPGAVEGLKDKLQQAEWASRDARRELLFYKADAGYERADEEKGIRIVVMEMDSDQGLLRDVASRLMERGSTVALLAGREPERKDAIYVYARSEDVGVNMGKLLSESARSVGGRGGGKADFAQGGGPVEAIYSARDILKKMLKEE